jgi:hypothetical protein
MFCIFLDNITENEYICGKALQNEFYKIYDKFLQISHNAVVMIGEKEERKCFARNAEKILGKRSIVLIADQRWNKEKMLKGFLQQGERAPKSGGVWRL